MTISEVCSVWQTVITGITAVVVGYYTFVTHQLRQDSKLQNKLLREQIDAARADADHRLKVARFEAEPRFRFVSGSTSSNSSTFTWVNDGGKIARLRAKGLSNVVVLFDPDTAVFTGQEAKLRVSGLKQETNYSFELVCVTALGEEKAFWFDGRFDGGYPKLRET